MPDQTLALLTDQERALLKLMAELDGDDVLEDVYSMGLHGRPLDIAVAAARLDGWSDGAAVIDALIAETPFNLRHLYNLDQRCDAPLDTAVYAWLAPF